MGRNASLDTYLAEVYSAVVSKTRLGFPLRRYFEGISKIDDATWTDDTPGRTRPI